MISFIIPIKNSTLAESLLFRLLASIEVLSSICINSIETIVVHTEHEFGLVLKPRFPALQIISVHDQSGQGVYAAYQKGLYVSSMPFCMFVGSDDILLPGLAQVLSVISLRGCDVAVCDYIHETRGLVRQNTLKVFLVFGNWCQQSVIYRTKSLLSLDSLFTLKYPIQADHDLHIRLRGDESIDIEKFSIPVALFSAGGLSSRVIDLKFKHDMHRILLRNLGFQYAMLSCIRSICGAVIRSRYSHPNAL